MSKRESRWDRIHGRRDRHGTRDIQNWDERLKDCCERLFSTYDGQEFLALLAERYLLASENEGASESALRSNAGVRNLVLRLEQLAQGSTTHARSGSTERSDPGEHSGPQG